MTKQEIDEMLSRHPDTITCPLPEECKKECKKAAKQLCDDIEMSPRDKLMLQYICPACNSKVEKKNHYLVCVSCKFSLLLWESQLNA